MKNQTYQYLLADARKALEGNRLLSALQSLQGMAHTLKAWSESEEIAGLQESYRMMLDYLSRGADDPARSKMYDGFVRRAWELCDVLERTGQLSDSDSYYAICRNTLQNLQGGNVDLAGLLVPQVNPRTLFEALWLSARLSLSEEVAVNDFLADERTDGVRKCLALSALTLSAMHFFDIAKYRILLDYALSLDIQLRVRALVGLLFVHISHPRRLERYPEMEVRLNLLSDVPGFVRELEAIQAQLFLTLETKRIEKNLQNEIIPRMMERMKDLRLDRSLGLDELKDKLSEIDLNPEWEADGTPSKLAEYMKEFVELQQRGADMYMGSFKMLKQRFPFFSVACNWFWPFTLEHPDLPADSRSNATLKMLLGSAGLCDSDKYSFSLIAAQLPQQPGGEALQRQMTEAMGAMGGFQQPEVPEEPVFKDVLRSYVQGFYRFCTLYTHREAFANPFKHNLLIVDYAPFDRLLCDSKFLVRMAEFVFADKSYALAKALLLRLPPRELTAGLYQKLGYCQERGGELEQAAWAYTQANDLKPHSAWTLRRLAACLRAQGLYGKALEAYDELAAIYPEQASVALHQAECHIHLGQYDEAFKALFKADYLAPDSRQAERAIGWCSLLTAKYEQAERYYEKVLSSDPTPTDWLNAGHAAWLLGRIPQAVERYRKALPEEQPERFLEDDADLLRKAGFRDEDLAMMTDAVLIAQS